MVTPASLNNAAMTKSYCYRTVLIPNHRTVTPQCLAICHMSR